MLVALVGAVGVLLSTYLGSFFLVVAEPQHYSQQNVCCIDRLRVDWPVFLTIAALDLYTGPHLLSFALAVALLVRLHTARRTRACLLRDGIFIEFVTLHINNASMNTK